MLLWVEQVKVLKPLKPTIHPDSMKVTDTPQAYKLPTKPLSKTDSTVKSCNSDYHTNIILIIT